MIIGDFNTKVGNILLDGCTRAFGMKKDDRNKRGDRLIEFFSKWRIECDQYNQKIICQRIHAKLKNVIKVMQFWFKQRMRTREALFVINTLIKSCWDINRNMFACFIDLTNKFLRRLFDNVRHN